MVQDMCRGRIVPMDGFGRPNCLRYATSERGSKGLNGPRKRHTRGGPKQPACLLQSDNYLKIVGRKVRLCAPRRPGASLKDSKCSAFAHRRKNRCTTFHCPMTGLTKRAILC